jgi:hypothetical protein
MEFNDDAIDDRISCRSPDSNEAAYVRQLFTLYVIFISAIVDQSALAKHFLGKAL